MGTLSPKLEKLNDEKKKKKKRPTAEGIFEPPFLIITSASAAVKWQN